VKDIKAILFTESAKRNDNGYKVEAGEPSKRTVFVERKNVTRTEHYSSMAAGILTTAVFIVYASEYHGEPFISAGGRNYRVTRTYPLSVNDIELTCTDEGVPQDEI